MYLLSSFSSFFKEKKSRRHIGRAVDKSIIITNEFDSFCVHNNKNFEGLVKNYCNDHFLEQVTVVLQQALLFDL